MHSTRELTRAVAAGDARALETIYRDHFDALYAYLRSATGRDESFCLDIIHDTMLKVIRSIPILESAAALEGWLRVAALSCARDRLRADARRRRREAAKSRLGEPTYDRAGAELESEDRAALARIEAVIAAIDPAAAELVLARHRFGWTLARIGAMVGLSPGAVDGRLSRALSTIRAQVEGGHDA